MCVCTLCGAACTAQRSAHTMLSRRAHTAKTLWRTVCHAQAALELWLDAELAQPAVDFGAATMHQHRPDADRQQQHQVSDDARLRACTCSRRGPADTVSGGGSGCDGAGSGGLRVRFACSSCAMPLAAAPVNITRVAGAAARACSSACDHHHLMAGCTPVTYTRTLTYTHLEGWVLHGSTTILDHHRLAGKALHVRQRLCQDRHAVKVAQVRDRQRLGGAGGGGWGMAAAGSGWGRGGALQSPGRVCWRVAVRVAADAHREAGS